MQAIRKVFNNKSGSDTTGLEGQPVTFDETANATGIRVSTAGEQASGIITKGGTTQTEVCVWGNCFAVASGTISGNGMRVTPGTAGIQDAATTNHECGFGHEAASAGSQVEIFFVPQMITRA